MMKKLDEDLWIGMKVTGTNNNNCEPYSWHSGVTGNRWKNWGNREPDQCRTDTCVRIKKKKWRTMTCTKTYKFICENASMSSENCQAETTLIQSTDSSGDVDVTAHQSTVQSTDNSGNVDVTAHQSTVQSTDNSGDVDVTAHQSTVQSTDSSGDVDVTAHQSTVQSIYNSGDVDVTAHQSTVQSIYNSGDVDVTAHQSTVQSTDSSGDVDVTARQSTVYPVSLSSICCAGKEKDIKCDQVQWGFNNTYRDKALEAQIKVLKQELKVILNSTKIYLRSKISVYDNRSSSATIGIVGVFVIMAVVVLPVAIDLVKLIAFVKQALKHRQHFSSS